MSTIQLFKEKIKIWAEQASERSTPTANYPAITYAQKTFRSFQEIPLHLSADVILNRNNIGKLLTSGSLVEDSQLQKVEDLLCNGFPLETSGRLYLPAKSNRFGCGGSCSYDATYL